MRRKLPRRGFRCKQKLARDIWPILCGNCWLRQGGGEARGLPGMRQKSADYRRVGGSTAAAPAVFLMKEEENRRCRPPCRARLGMQVGVSAGIDEGDMAVIHPARLWLPPFSLIRDLAGGVGKADQKQKEKGQVKELFHLHRSFSPEADVLMEHGNGSTGAGAPIRRPLQASAAGPALPRTRYLAQILHLQRFLSRKELRSEVLALPQLEAVAVRGSMLGCRRRRAAVRQIPVAFSLSGKVG